MVRVQIRMMPWMALLVTATLAAPSLLAGPLEGPEWCEGPLVVHECARWVVEDDGATRRGDITHGGIIPDPDRGRFYVLREADGLALEARQNADGSLAAQHALIDRGSSIAVDTGDGILVLGGRDAIHAVLFDKASLEPVWSGALEGSGPFRVVVSEDGARFAVSWAERDPAGQIQWWLAEYATADGGLVWTAQTPAYAMGYSSNGTLHRVRYPDDRTVLEGFAPGTPDVAFAYTVPSPGDTRAAVGTLVPGPDGSLYLSGLHLDDGFRQGYVTAFRDGAFAWMRVIGEHTHVLNVSPDGLRLAASPLSSQPPPRILLDTSTGAEVLRLEGMGPFVAPAFSPDGTRVFFAAANTTSTGIVAYAASNGERLFGTGISFPPRIRAVGMAADEDQVYLSARTYEIPYYRPREGDPRPEPTMLLAAFPAGPPQGGLLP